MHPIKEEQSVFIHASKDEQFAVGCFLAFNWLDTEKATLALQRRLLIIQSHLMISLESLILEILKVLAMLRMGHS